MVTDGAPDRRILAAGSAGVIVGGLPSAARGRVDREGSRAMETLTRFHLSEAIRRAKGFSHAQSREPVDSVLDIVSDRLSAGEAVKIPSFGTFTVRGKAARAGRNPKTGEEFLVSARRVVLFRASPRLRERIVRGMAGGGPGAAGG